MNIPPSLLTIINNAEEDSLVIVYVKKLICNKEIEFETTIKEKIVKSEKKFHYLSICYESHEIPFPEPHINRVYFFLPKSKSYSLVADAMHVANNFENVIQVVGKTADEVKNIFPRPNTPVDKFTKEQIEKQKQMLEQEDVSKFPTAFQMTRNLLKAGWDSAKNVTSGRQWLVSSEEAHKRLTICESCPNYKEKKCVLCGCFMEQKTHLQVAECPQNKW